MRIWRLTNTFGAVGTLLIASYASVVMGQPLSDLLQQEIVTDVGDRLVVQHTLECRLLDLEPVYLNRYLEASSDLISRDVAVFLSTRLLFAHQAHLMHSLTLDVDPEDLSPTMPCRLSNPVATADFSINAIMNSDGIRVETIDVTTGETAVDFLEWAELFSQ